MTNLHSLTLATVLFGLTAVSAAAQDGRNLSCSMKVEPGMADHQIIAVENFCSDSQEDNKFANGAATVQVVERPAPEPSPGEESFEGDGERFR